MYAEQFIFVANSSVNRKGSPLVAQVALADPLCKIARWNSDLPETKGIYSLTRDISPQGISSRLNQELNGRDVDPLCEISSATDRILSVLLLFLEYL